MVEKMSVYFTSNNQKISLDQKPLGGGGEGVIYVIKNPSNLTQYCVKIYDKKFQTHQREQKIAYMIKNPPMTPKGALYKICWPCELIYNKNRQFKGIMIPHAFHDSISLYELCLPQIKAGLSQAWNKFERAHAEGILARCKLCVNLAISIHTVHNLDEYTFVDMKPQNILVTHDGKISLIDFDSIQIAHGKNVLYPAQVMTPEYAPPEAERFTLLKDYVPLYWDRFSLAVIIYEVLFGLHPFVNTCNGQYHYCTTLYEKIQHGLSHLGPNKNSIQTLPKLHNKFHELPQPLKDLFFRAFREGHHLPDVRPSAEDWGKTFYRLISDVQLSSSVSQQPTQIQNHGVPKLITQQQANTQVVAQKSNCFIATVVYESPSADEVILLRRFRDTILFPSYLGRILVNMYYRFSPPIARTLSRHNRLKKFVKTMMLDPFVRFTAKLYFDS